MIRSAPGRNRLQSSQSMLHWCKSSSTKPAFRPDLEHEFWLSRRQFGWGLQLANMSAIYAKLGADVRRFRSVARRTRHRPAGQPILASMIRTCAGLVAADLISPWVLFFLCCAVLMPDAPPSGLRPPCSGYWTRRLTSAWNSSFCRR